MRYLLANEKELALNPNLIRLMWPDGVYHRHTHATYYIPESHANIALLALALHQWKTVDNLSTTTKILAII